MTVLFHLFIVAYNGSEEISTFGCVNRHTVRMWGSQHSYQTFQTQRYSPKVTVCCGVSNKQFIGPIFFADRNGNVYLDMMEIRRTIGQCK